MSFNKTALWCLLLFWIGTTTCYSKTVVMRIDATKDLDSAIEQYKDAIEGAKKGINLKIYLRVNPRIGFDAGYLRIDESVRKINVRIIINVVGSNRVRAPIVLNAMVLKSTMKVYELNQAIHIF